MQTLRKFASALLAVMTATAPVAAQDEPAFFFRYKGLLEVHAGNGGAGSGTEEPGSPDDGGTGGPEEPAEEDDSLRFTGSYRTTAVAGVTYHESVSALGGTGNYTFSGLNFPHFMAIEPDGSITISTTEDDVGEYSGFNVVVDDGENAVTSRNMRINVVVQPEGIPMAAAAYLNGTEIGRHYLYNSKTGKDDRVLLGTGENIELVYDAPITAPGAFVHAGGSVALEAFVEGQWEEVGRTSGTRKQDLLHPILQRFTSERWRIRRIGSGNVNVRGFRPGPSPNHDLPEFITPSGHVGSKGMTARIEGNAYQSRYTDAPLSFRFADGVTPPSGVSLGVEGVLEIDANADFQDTWNFTVVARDGVGFENARDFWITHEAPDAATVMAKSFSINGTEVDYRYMYDGAQSHPSTPVTVTRSMPLVVDFGFPVKAESVALGWAGGSASRARIEYESGGQWHLAGTVQRSTNAPARALDGPVAAQRFRVLSDTSASFTVGEFRIGAGPVHMRPYFDGNAYLATLSEIDSVAIPAVAAVTYTNATVDPTFEITGGMLPPSLTLLTDGTFEAMSDEGEGEEWTFTITVTDAEGFSASREFVIGNTAFMAADFMPSSVTHGGTEVGPRVLYNGLAGNDPEGFRIVSPTPVILDYGRPVQFDRAFVAKSTNNVNVSIEANGEWVHIATLGSMPSSGQAYLFGGNYVAQRVMLSRTDASTGSTVREFRLGNGPAHAAPAITIPDEGISLDEGPSQMALSVSSDVSHYFPGGNQVTWSVAAGALPSGASLSPSGILHLPSRHDVSGFSWPVVFRVQDQAGFYDEKEAVITTGGALPANIVMARSISRTDAGVDLLYDGATASSMPSISGISNNNPLVIDYGRPVAFDSLYYSASSSLRIDIETSPGNWQEIDSLVSGNRSHSFSQSYVTQRVRVRTANSSASTLREFRLGNGPAHFAPTILETGMTAVLAAGETHVDLRLDWTDHYLNSSPSLAIIDGTMPPGASIDRNGTLHLPAAGEIDTETGLWAFTVRVSDGLGYWTDNQVIVRMEAPSAAEFLPVTVHHGSTPVDRDVLYDGVTSTTAFPGYSVSSAESTWLTYTYAHPVSFKDFETSPTSISAMYIEAQAEDGQWIYAGSMGSSRSLSDTWTAKRFRLKRDSNSTAIREFRAGGGPVHFNPVSLDQSVFLAVLSDAPQTIHLAATASPYAKAPLAWEITGGTLPPGASVTPSGVLTLPAVSETATYRVTARISDDVGGMTDVVYFLAGGSQPSSSTLPSTITYGSSTNVNVSILYDNATTEASSILLPENGTLTFEFPYQVSVSSMRIKTSSAVTRDWRIEFEMDGVWHSAADYRGNASSTRNVNFDQTFHSRRFRITMTGGSAVTLQTLKLGSTNGIYPEP